MRLFTSLLSALIFQFAFSQIPVGHYIDSQGWPIVGYFDPMEYRSNVQIQHVQYADKFEHGFIYTKSGNKIEGEIKIGSEISYKAEDSKKLNVSSDSILAVVVELDSFIITKKLAITSNQLCSDQRGRYQPIRYLFSFDSVDFAIFNNTCNVTGDQYIYLMKPERSPTWLSVPESEGRFNYLMGYSDTLNYQKKLKAEDKVDPVVLIKKAAYNQKYVSKTPIYFDSWWNEIIKPSDRYANIVSLDSMITLEYFENEILINRSVYKFEIPLVREGLSEWYYSSGIKRKETFYKENDPLYVKEYFENGNLHYHYQIVTNDLQKFNSWNEFSLIRYAQVNDESGNSVLDGIGNGTEKLNDLRNNRIITRTFSNRSLTSSFFEVQSKKIFQLPSTELKMKGLQNKWDHFDADNDLDDAYGKDAAGYQLVSCLIIPQGYLSKHKILNDLNSGVSLAVNKFFGQPDIKFEKLVIYNKKVAYEVAIPFVFTASRFYSESPTYHWWMQDQLMYQNPLHWKFQYKRQQQEIQNHLKDIEKYRPKVPSPPSFPR